MCGSHTDDGTESKIGVQDIVIDVDTGLNLDGDVAFIETPRVDPPDDRRVACRVVVAAAVVVVFIFVTVDVAKFVFLYPSLSVLFILLLLLLLFCRFYV